METDRTFHGGLRRPFLPLLFPALALLAYHPSLGAFFLSDDFMLVHIVRTQGPLSLWCGGPCLFFRPLVSLSLFLDHGIWGLWPPGFHLTGILVHGANSFLVCLLHARVSGGARGESILAGLLFLVLPVHVEAVTWISCRPDLLATFFGLLCLVSLWGPRGDIRAGGALAVSSLFFLASLLAKESTAALPLILAALVLARRREAAGAGMGMPGFPILAPFAAMALFYLLLRKWALGTWLGGYGMEVHFMNIWSHPLLALKVTVAFLAKTFLPQEATKALWGLGDYPLFQLAAALAATAALALAGLLLSREDRRRTGFWIACQVAALVPVLGLGISLSTTEGDRFLYFPSIFGVLALARLLSSLFRGPRFVPVAASVLVVFTAFLLFHQADWTGAGDLARETLARVDEQAGRAEIVLDPPADYRGAYVFKNGLREAVLLFHGERAWERVRRASPRGEGE